MSPPDFTDAAAYDAWYQTPLGRLCGVLESRAVLELAAVKRGEKTLDIGCGTGYFTLVLARAGAEVTGIDDTEAMVVRARDNASREKGLARPSSYRHASFFRPAELEKLLTASGFLVTERRTLLYFPPLNSRPLLSRYQWFERAGARLFPGGGVFIAVSAARRP